MNDLIDKFNVVPLAHKLVGLFFLMVAIVVGYLMFVQSPMKEEITGLETEAASQTRELGRLEQVRLNQAEVIVRLEDLNRQLQIAREKLPESAEVPRLLQRIHAQAQTAGLSIERFQRDSDVARNDFIEIPVQMRLVGTFDEMVNFFYFVGRMTRIVNIRNITMTRTRSGLNPEGELQVSAQATTYRWNPN